eukprot:COSAG01_NODE_7247_length_3283_cov_404.497173_5_plen_54_part_01
MGEMRTRSSTAFFFRFIRTYDAAGGGGGGGGHSAPPRPPSVASWDAPARGPAEQ